MAFAFIKQYSVLLDILPGSLFEQKIVLVGLSYMLFRQIHIVVDAFQGQIQQLSFWDYLNYQLNPFGLQAGPIQRYQEFSEQWAQMKPALTTKYEILQAYLRLFIGVIKVLGLASLCFWLYRTAQQDYLEATSRTHILGGFIFILCIFPAYLYFNFSGYCDIMISGASLFGIRMPENFMRPFLSRNIGELWTKWHRTLGLWIRDYLFTPIFKGTVERWPLAATPAIFVSYLLAFSIAGLWHGSTLNFLIFGLLNGVGMCCAKAWEMTIIRFRGRAGLKRYLQSSRIKILAVFITISYFGFTLIFWAHDMSESVLIIRKLLSVL